ncbi:hypothetical protein TSUD_83420 [Trifolium subterraneum]|uniref:Uncharacterized protein n=1 Tax=Trifolium subterraneum TaxID=3900 RepID=A0A2Z6NF61_TRISU|nr:hypothetical protein TSUD_83420 [Trifolium subterraneum]
MAIHNRDENLILGIRKFVTVLFLKKKGKIDCDVPYCFATNKKKIESTSVLFSYETIHDTTTLILAQNNKRSSSDDRVMNDDAEAANEAMAVRSQWKRKRMRSQFGQGWQTTDLFHKEVTPVARYSTCSVDTLHVCFKREDLLSNLWT